MMMNLCTFLLAYRGGCSNIAVELVGLLNTEIALSERTAIKATKKQAGLCVASLGSLTVWESRFLDFVGLMGVGT